ncbi:MAG: arylsulfatase [Planctomycetaceae bacterium]|jgi:arylsulfatase A-like enzyme|nr:arylsulfatase [Planctomycetaceae bacterium]
MRVVGLTLTLLVLTAAFALAADNDKPKNEKPNIVYFLADDLGWADVGWHGTEIKTPNLDKLAAQGVKFEQFYVQPLCTQTRAAFLTGRYPSRYGLQTGVIIGNSYGLSLEERTLPQALHDAGYYTVILGKWHLGSEKEYQPLQRGFDYHYGFYSAAIDYYEHTNELGHDWYRNGQNVKEKGYSTDLIGDEAVKVIEKHDTSKPLFLYVPFNAVHFPYQEIPNKKLSDQYENLHGQRKIYGGITSVLDDAVGRIYQALEKKGVLDNTLILFSSDNGGPTQPKQASGDENISEPSNDRNFRASQGMPGPADNGNLRAGKGTLYEGGVRVPAFAIWHGKIKPDTVSDQLIHIVDLYPTFLDIAGASLEQKLPLDGADFKDVLTENKTKPRKEVLINAEVNRGAIRFGDWKIVISNLDADNKENAKTELFNVKDDPGETNDLSASNSEKLKELQELYEKYASEAIPSLFRFRSRNSQTPR